MKVLARQLGLAVLLCAAADTVLTRAEHAYRPAGWRLPAEALAGWAALALLVAWPGLRLARRLQAPLAAAALVLAGPVLLHAAVRGPWRSGSAADLALAAALALTVLAAAVSSLRWVERRGPPGAAGPLLALAAVLALWPWSGGADAPAAPRPAARPNLLLLVWDTTRADRLGPYGYARATTPHLDDLARRSLVYETCWSASVFTLSSHVSLLTGLPPALHGTTLRRQWVTAPAVASRLREVGYRTGAFVGTSVLEGGRGLERGFDVYDDLVDPPLCDTHLWALLHDLQALAASLAPDWFGANGLPHWFQDFQRPAPDVLAEVLAFARDEDPRPWFALVNLFDVHWPYLPAPASARTWVRPYDGLLGGYLFRADDYPADQRPGPRDVRHVSDLYDAEMWQLDRAVDAFLGQLDLAGGNTAVLLSSDHGEALGDSNEWSHEHLRQNQTRVPLLVFAPGRVTAGARQAVPASGVDVMPTLLDLAGLPPVRGVAGHSLLGAGPPADRAIIIQDHDHVRPDEDEDAVLKGGFKLLSAGGRLTLHDLAADPLDRHDLSAEHPQWVAELSAVLQALRAASAESDSGLLENEDVLRALGYL